MTSAFACEKRYFALLITRSVVPPIQMSKCTADFLNFRQGRARAERCAEGRRKSPKRTELGLFLIPTLSDFFSSRKNSLTPLNFQKLVQIRVSILLVDFRGSVQNEVQVDLVH